MTPEQYRKIRDGLDARPTLRQLVLFCNHWLPAVPFVCYPVLLVILNVQWFALLQAGSAAALDFMQQIARAILVPGITFWFGTALRARLDRPRPYEQPGFVPLVAKETKGHSFPSRHALSAAVLAMTWLRFFPGSGRRYGHHHPAHLCTAGTGRGALGAGRSLWSCPGLRAGGRGHVAVVSSRPCETRKKKKTGIFKFVLDRVPEYGIILLAACADTHCRHTGTQWDNNVRP